MDIINVIAVDLGASSGRLISGTFDGNSITLSEQFRFSNQPIKLADSLYWDYLRIFQEVKYGISISDINVSDVESISVDTWGVDYGFIDNNGKVISAPYCYRDNRTSKYSELFEKKYPKSQQFLETGVQPSDINSNIQLFSDFEERPYLKRELNSILFMPNLIEYFLSGVKSSEFTIVSTSGLLDKTTHEMNSTVVNQYKFKASWLGDIEKEGVILGKINPDIVLELGLKSDISVISGVGHDTAAALMSLPIEANKLNTTAFISCGTWSIVGIQTIKPIVSDEVFNSGMTNEGCYGGNNRLLKNITGLWIIQELQQEWSFKGDMLDFDYMVTLAKKAGPSKSFIDLDYKQFAIPGNMENKINTYLLDTNQDVPNSRGELLRIVYESLANSYAQTITSIEKITNNNISEIFMFGGGTKNDLLVQLTANYTNKVVRTGSVEASALGNAICQLLTLGALDEKSRVEVLNNSFNSDIVRPQKY